MSQEISAKNIINKNDGQIRNEFYNRLFSKSNSKAPKPPKIFSSSAPEKKTNPINIPLHQTSNAASTFFFDKRKISKTSGNEKKPNFSSSPTDIFHLEPGDVPFSSRADDGESISGAPNNPSEVDSDSEYEGSEDQKTTNAANILEYKRENEISQTPFSRERDDFRKFKMKYRKPPKNLDEYGKVITRRKEAKKALAKPEANEKNEGDINQKNANKKYGF